MRDRRQRFEALALPHMDAAYNLARWLSRSPADADDIVQDAMLRAYRAFGQAWPARTSGPGYSRSLRNCWRSRAADTRRRAPHDHRPAPMIRPLVIGVPTHQAEALRASESRAIAGDDRGAAGGLTRTVLILREESKT